MQQRLAASGESQISLSDPDSRSMPVAQGVDVCYNVEVVDLAKFYSPDQIRKAREGQRDYAKFLADRGI